MEEPITPTINPRNRMSRMRLHAQSLAQPVNPEGLSYLDDLWNTAALDWGIGQGIQTLAIRAKRGAMFQDDLQGYNPYRDEDFSEINPQYYREFLDARTPEQFLAVKDMIETNTRRRNELDQNNAFVTRLIGNALNPSILIPIPFARGIGFREGFKKTAPIVGGLLGTEEYLRHELDPTSTIPETLFTIGGGTLFGGALGGLAGMVGSKTIGRTTKQWFEDHQKIVETSNRLEDEMPGVTDGIRPQQAGTEATDEGVKSFVRPVKGETTKQYQERIDKIVADPKLYDDYSSVSRSYEPDRLVETGIGLEKLSPSFHPFYALKNNLFRGFAGNSVARFADEMSGPLGLMNKGNREGDVASSTAVYSMATLHNPKLIQAKTDMWDAYMRQVGIKTDVEKATPAGQAFQYIKQSISPTARQNYREWLEEVTQVYLTPNYVAKTPEIQEGVTAMSNYMNAMGKELAEVGAYSTSNLQFTKGWMTKTKDRLDQRLIKWQGILKNLKSKDSLSKKQFDLKKDIEEIYLPDMRDKQIYLNDRLQSIEKTLNDPQGIPQLEPGSPGHFHRMWKQKAVQENREVLERILEQAFIKNETVGERVADTVDNILKIGKLGKVARQVEDLMKAEKIEPYIIARTKKKIEAISKMRGSDRKPLSAIERNEEARILIDRVVRDYGLGNGVAKESKKIIDEIEALSRNPGAEILEGNTGLLSRRLNLPSHLFINVPELRGGSFIETDPELVLKAYHRKTSMAIEMQRRYGDINGQKRIDELEEMMDEEINLLFNEKGKEAEIATLIREKKKQVQAATDLRDKTIGVYAIPEDPSSLGFRATQFTKNWMVMALMGKATVAALADIGRTVGAVGFKETVGGTFDKFTIAAKEFRKAGEEVELAGEAAEMALHGRFEVMMDIDPMYAAATAGERLAQEGANAMFLLNGLSAYTDMMKRFSGGIIQSQMIESSIKWSKGQKLTPRQKETLLRLGIDKDDAKAIAKQWQDAGAVGPGNGTNKLYLANTEKWTDVEVTRKFRAGLAEEVNNAVITPRPGDKPNFADTPLGSVIFQFKSFGMGATNRTLLAGLQQKDAQALHGMLSMIGLGYLVDVIRSGPYDSRPLISMDRFIQAVDYSGVTGILFELNNMLETSTGAFLESPLGIRPLAGIDPAFGDTDAARAIGTSGGPTFGLLAKLISSITDSDASTADQIKAVRRLLPFNQLIWWAWAVDRVQRDAITLTED